MAGLAHSPSPTVSRACPVTVEGKPLKVAMFWACVACAAARLILSASRRIHGANGKHRVRDLYAMVE